MRRLFSYHESLLRATTHLPQRFEVVGPPSNLDEPPQRQGVQPFGSASVYYFATSRGSGIWMKCASGFLYVYAAPETVSLRQGRRPFVVLRPIRTGSCEGFAEDLNRLRTHLGSPIIVKNLSLQLARTLMQIDSRVRAYDKGEFWDPACALDDQTFPEVVIDLPKSKNRLRFKHPLQRVEIDFDKHGITKIDSLLSQWEPWYKGRHHSFDKSNILGFYRYLFSEAAGRVAFGYFFELQGNCVGLACASRVRQGQIDMWACVSCRQPRDISRHIFASCFDLWREEGVRFVNLGGSETESLHRFKMRLVRSGIFLLDRAHVVYD